MVGTESDRLKMGYSALWKNSTPMNLCLLLALLMKLIIFPHCLFMFFTGSTTTPPQDRDSGEVCSQLKQLQQHKALTGKLKILLEALFEAFCNKDLAKTSTSTTLTSTTLTSAPVTTALQTGENKRENKDQKPPKSAGDRKFLWIVLGVLGVLMLVTVLTLKSKVLICTRTYTNAGVADNMEEKMYSANDDIVLLGVTPGAEGEDDWCFSPKGSPGYEDISPRSTC
ncbi:uncharacterized protein LOC135255864 isoform X3 [Anguilla rostrata]|uniref:uncharacterized protein LOC135255864 isoform X3 n=1 Tax=Anguilla rostrata TaxID=7938 RepID=UPI0030CE95DF